jgi:hypothetical protein
MKLTVADSQRHSGVTGGGVVIDGDGIRVSDGYREVEWFEVIQPSSYCLDVTSSANDHLIQNMLLHGCSPALSAIRVQSSSTIRNTFIFDNNTGITVNAGAGGATIENVSVYGMTDYGIKAFAGPTVVVRNTISVGNGGDDFALPSANLSYFGYNMYTTVSGFDPASFQGNNQSPPTDLDDLFVSITGGSENLHLHSSGHDALDAGLDLASVFTDDIDGGTRPGGVAWEIGADEISASAAGFGVNYRSIGTNAAVLYSTGDASIASGGSVVTFAGGASLPTNIGAGDKLVITSTRTDTLYILSRDSATQVTVQGTATNNHLNGTYTIERAYNAFQDWESGRGGDLVADQRQEVGVAYADGDFTAGATISGSYTDSTHYLKLTVADGQRHSGVAGAGVRIDAQAGLGEDVLAVQDEYTQIEWLQITNFNDGVGIDGLTISENADNSVVQYLVIWNFDGADSGVRLRGDATVRNTIIYDGQRGMKVEAGAVATIENVTVYGMTGTGIRENSDSGTAVTIRNAISVGNGTSDFSLTGTISYFGYNLYTTVAGFDPADFQGNNQSPPATVDDLFVTITAGSEDLHLEASGHDALRKGVDLSGSFTDDIDGDTRSVAWDIGADETSTGTSSVAMISSTENQTFRVNDPAADISVITIRDAEDTPTITATSDIRIQIPAGFNMVWDSSDPNAVISGPAASKVSAAVTFEGTDAVLVLDVTNNFAGSRSRISSLRASRPAPLRTTWSSTRTTTGRPRRRTTRRSRSARLW